MTYYHLRCRKCGSSTEGIADGSERKMLQVWEGRSSITAFRRAIDGLYRSEAFFEVTTKALFEMDEGIEPLADWLEAHTDHDVIVEDEYCRS